MKGITLLVIASVLALSVLSVVFAASPGNTDVGASVTVNAYKSVTVTPCATPLSFSSVNQGTNDNPVQCAVGGDIIVTNDVASNANIDVSIKGTDFTGAGTIAVGQAGWDTDDTATTTTALTTGFASVQTGLTPSSSVSTYFFLDVPNPQTSGAYSSTFTVNTA